MNNMGTVAPVAASASAPDEATQPPPPVNNNKEDNSMPKEHPDASSQSSSPGERSTKRMRLSPGPEIPRSDNNPVEGDTEDALARPSALIPPLKNGTKPALKSYDCPACEATNMSGQKLREHFLSEHKEVAAAANNNIATSTNYSSENKSTGMWNDTERQKFEAGCIIFGWGKWAAVATLMSTRDKAQIKSHAQKFQLHRPKEYQELTAYHNVDDLSDNYSTKSNVSGNDSITSSNAGGSSWTEEEQEQFKMGVIINGWGSWNEIAKNVPTKTTTQVRNRALNIQRYRQDEEARLKAEHAKLVSRNPQLFSTDYVRQVTGADTAEKPINVAGSVKKHDIVTCFPLPAKSKSTKSTNSNQGSVKTAKSDNGYAEGTWTPAEHNQFEQAVIQYGWGDWVSITQKIPTRDKKQVKSHAQKFDIHHPGGKDRLQKEHQKAQKKKLKKAGDAKRKKLEEEKKAAEEEKKKMGEEKTADDAMEVEENADVTFEEEKIDDDDDDDDKMEVEQIDENEQDEQRAEEGEKSTEEEEKEEEKETEVDEEASTTFSDESRQQQQLRVSPRVVKAPRDNYMDSLQKDQWQRKKKVSKYRYPKGQAPSNSMPANFGGIRKRNDDSHVSFDYCFLFIFSSCRRCTRCSLTNVFMSLSGGANLVRWEVV